MRKAQAELHHQAARGRQDRAARQEVDATPPRQYRHRRACPGASSLIGTVTPNDVDARHKPGHDDGAHHGHRRLSPRPEIRSRHAGDRRREARDRGGRHPLREPHRRAARRARRRAPRSPASSPNRNARRRRSNGAATSSRARSRARWWSIPATPTPSPARPAGRPAQFTAEIAARAIGCKPSDVFLASTGVIGEPLDAKAFDGVMEGLVAAARPEPLARGRQGDHDHRHLPEGRDRDGEARRARRSPSTASPRAPA